MRTESETCRFLSGLAVSILVASCGDDRSAGGTIGTEAGNAIAARLLTSDGKPAARALVTARPADAIDSMGRDKWVREVADSNGVVHLHLPEGPWTLESNLGNNASRLDIQVASDLVVTDTIVPFTVVDGVMLGALAGERIYLPGLARSGVVQANGRFHFDSIPSGPTRIRREDGTTWQVTDSVLSAVVLFPDTSMHPLPGHSFATPTLTEPVRFRVADSLLFTSGVIVLDGQGKPIPPSPSGSTTILDALGTPIPMLIGPLRNGFRQIWTGPSTRPAAALVKQRTTNTSPFAKAQGLRFAWLPEFADSNLVGTAKFVFDTSVKMDSLSSEGRFRKDVRGFSMGTFSDSPLPDTGTFSLSARIRLHAPSTASVPVWNWVDPATNNGFSLKVGGDRMDLHLGSRDTSLVVATPASWSTWCVAWDRQNLTVWVDGVEVFRAAATGMAARASWTRRQFAPNGALDVSGLLVWDRAVDGLLVSGPVETRK